MHDHGTIVIRPAYPDDHGALQRLAALDSATVPPAPMLVAEAGGELRAALSTVDGASIADPFWPTAELVELLRVHARAPAVGVAQGRRLAARRLRPA